MKQPEDRSGCCVLRGSSRECATTLLLLLVLLLLGLGEHPLDLVVAAPGGAGERDPQLAVLALHGAARLLPGGHLELALRRGAVELARDAQGDRHEVVTLHLREVVHLDHAVDDGFRHLHALGLLGGLLLLGLLPLLRLVLETLLHLLRRLGSLGVLDETSVGERELLDLLVDGGRAVLLLVVGVDLIPILHDLRDDVDRPLDGLALVAEPQLQLRLLRLLVVALETQLDPDQEAPHAHRPLVGLDAEDLVRELGPVPLLQLLEALLEGGLALAGELRDLIAAEELDRVLRGVLQVVKLAVELLAQHARLALDLTTGRLLAVLPLLLRLLGGTVLEDLGQRVLGVGVDLDDLLEVLHGEARILLGRDPEELFDGRHDHRVRGGNDVQSRVSVAGGHEMASLNWVIPSF